MQAQRHVCLWVMVGVCVLFAHSAGAEVRLLDRMGGRTLNGGSEFRIEWAVLQYEPVENWDLYYSTGPQERWMDLALDLYPNDFTTSGGRLWYDWTIPQLHATRVRLKIVQDGLNGTWEDISDEEFTILPEPQAAALLATGGLWLLLRRRRFRMAPLRQIEFELRLE